MAETITGEFIARIDDQSSAKGNLRVYIEASDRAALKAAILAQVTKDGKASSGALEVVLPAVLKGVAQGIRTVPTIAGDISLAADLLDLAVTSGSRSLVSHVDKIADKSVTVAVLAGTMTAEIAKALSDLAGQGAPIPQENFYSIPTNIAEVLDQLGPGAPSKVDLLTSVVGASVGVAAAKPALVRAIFLGMARANPTDEEITQVVAATVAAHPQSTSGETSKLIAYAVASLNSTDVTLVNAINAASQKALAASGSTQTIDTASVLAVLTEAPPVASLTVAVDGTPITKPLAYQADGYDVTFSTTGSTAGAPTLIVDQNGKVYTGTVHLTAVGTYDFTLTVTNATGVKSARSEYSISIGPIVTVSFSVDGGSAVANVTGVVAGSTIAAPTDPTLSGSYFAGWYANAALTDVWDFAKRPVTANTTLYASWIPAKYVGPWFDKQGTDTTVTPAKQDLNEVILVLQSTGDYIEYQRSHYRWADLPADLSYYKAITVFTQDDFIPIESGRFTVKNDVLVRTVVTKNVIAYGLMHNAATEAGFKAMGIDPAKFVGLMTLAKAAAMVNKTTAEGNTVRLFVNQTDTLTLGTIGTVSGDTARTLSIQNSGLYKSTYLQVTGEESGEGFRTPLNLPAVVSALLPK